MFDNAVFQKLVEDGNLTGKVVTTNSFIIEVKGLYGVKLGSRVLFEDGQHGLVREAYKDRVVLFNIDSESIKPFTSIIKLFVVTTLPVKLPSSTSF